MLEPRRLATRAAARRMADLVGDTVGGLVGYQTRDERHIGPRTRIEVITEGVLTRRLQRDPELPGSALVDLRRGPRAQPHDRPRPGARPRRGGTLRPDLRILAMSATADTGHVRRAARCTAAGRAGRRQRGPDAPSGRAVAAAAGRRDRLEDAVPTAVRRPCARTPATCSSSCPGIGEISRVPTPAGDPPAPTSTSTHWPGPSRSAEQDAALAPSPPGPPAGRARHRHRRDVADRRRGPRSSSTAASPGPALRRRHGYDPTDDDLDQPGLGRPASRAGRPDRAGRRLPTVEPDRARDPARPPRGRDHPGRSRWLGARAGGVGPPTDGLRFLDPPPPRALRQAAELLTALGALEARPADRRSAGGCSTCRSTPGSPGWSPPTPRALSCVVAALVDERDVLRGRPDDLPADLALRVRLISGETTDDRADRACRRPPSASGPPTWPGGPASGATGRRSTPTGPACCARLPRPPRRPRRPGQFQLRTGGAAWVPPTIRWPPSRSSSPPISTGPGRGPGCASVHRLR